jgi:hypothetical protein
MLAAIRRASSLVSNFRYLLSSHRARHFAPTVTKFDSDQTFGSGNRKNVVRDQRPSMRYKALIATLQVLLGIVASALIFFVSGSHATDNGQWKDYHLTPYQQYWFSTVMVPQSDIICCTVADGYPVRAETHGDHFWINYKGNWYEVPDAAVSILLAYRLHG